MADETTNMANRIADEPATATGASARMPARSARRPPVMPGTRILVFELTEDGDARPLREGKVHSISETHADVQWVWGRDGYELMRLEDAARWVWR